jgi:hypothetical protein
MSDDSVLCPDCKSKDVQKIEDKAVVLGQMEEGCLTRPLRGVFKIAGILIICFGLLGLLACVVNAIGGSSGVASVAGSCVVVLAVGGVCLFVGTRKLKERDTSKTVTDSYYVCRSCGKEFRNN